MSITFSCPNPGCGKRYTVPDDAAGRKTTCTSCGMRMQIPAGGQGPPLPPADVFEERSHSRGRPTAAFDDEFDVEPDDGRSVRRSRGGKPSRGGFMDFVLFKFLIAPRILIVLYWVLVVLVILGSLFFMVASFFTRDLVGILVGVFGGLLMMLVYPILLRISFEFALVVFRIYDTLQEIRDNTTPNH
jgi:hypothetical protein